MAEGVKVMRSKERYLQLVMQVSGLSREELSPLPYKELRALKQAYRSVYQIKYKTRKRSQKLKDCWGVR